MKPQGWIQAAVLSSIILTATKLTDSAPLLSLVKSNSLHFCMTDVWSTNRKLYRTDFYLKTNYFSLFLRPHCNCEKFSDEICYSTDKVFVHPPTCINKIFFLIFAASHLPAEDHWCLLEQFKTMPGFMFSPSVFVMHLGLQLIKLNSSDREKD